MGRLKLANPINACDYFKYENEQADSNEQFIYVAQRGDCTFVQKSHFAQLAGAKLLLIVDNKYEDVEQRLMVDDGNLGNIFPHKSSVIRLNYPHSSRSHHQAWRR
jgi:uncharacterized protein (DUF952 family)